MCVMQSSAQPSYHSSNDDDSMHQNLDKLFYSEIRRRRERDFGHNSDSSSFSDQAEEECEEDRDSILECDSLCTESEVNADIRNLDGLSCDSESDIAEQKDNAGLYVLLHNISREVHTCLLYHACRFWSKDIGN